MDRPIEAFGLHIFVSCTTVLRCDDAVGILVQHLGVGWTSL